MAKIINNKWYTDEEYDREYHEVVLWGGYLTFLNVLKVEGEEVINELSSCNKGRNHRNNNLYQSRTNKKCEYHTDTHTKHW